jgi:tol-pal system protein YbgF
MLRSSTLLFVVLASFIGTGCATRSSVRDLSTRVGGLGKDIADVRQQQETMAKGMGPMSTDIQTLNTRLQQTEMRLREAGDRIVTLGNRTAATETSLRETITAMEALARPPAVAPAERLPEPRESSINVEQAFAGALKIFSAGEYGQAVLELTDLVARKPDHPLAARAQIWIGEAYFRQRDYRQALKEYRKAVDSASDASVIADGWLKIGQTHAMLRQRSEATAAWRRVVREYPDTEAAGRARKLLRK